MSFLFPFCIGYSVLDALKYVVLSYYRKMCVPFKQQMIVFLCKTKFRQSPCLNRYLLLICTKTCDDSDACMCLACRLCI